MASLIQIKRSTTTATPPDGLLRQGELAFTYFDSPEANAVPALFIGGEDANVAVRIGGEDFQYIYNTTPGAVEASKAVVVNENQHIDTIAIATLKIGSNTDAAAANTVDINAIATSQAEIGVGDENTLTTAAAVKAYADQAETDARAYTDTRETAITTAYQTYADSAGSNAALEAYTNAIAYVDSFFPDAQTITISGDSGSNITFNQSTGTLTFEGGTGIETTISSDQVSFALEDTGVVADTYGSASALPIITVDAKGRITNVSTTSFTAGVTIGGYNADLAANTTDIVPGGETLNFIGSQGANVQVSNNQVEVLVNNLQAALIDGSQTFDSKFRIDHTDVNILSGDGIQINNAADGAGADLTADMTVNLRRASDSGLSVSAGAVAVGVGNGLSVSGTTVNLVADDGIEVGVDGIKVTAGQGISLSATDGSGAVRVDVPNNPANNVDNGGELEFNADGALKLPQLLGPNNDVSFNDVTVNGTLFADQIFPVTGATVTIAGALTITGDLTASGNTTFQNETTVELGDTIITLAANTPNSSPLAVDAGIEINRGSDANAFFVWDASGGYWSTGDEGAGSTANTDAGIFIGGYANFPHANITGGVIQNISGNDGDSATDGLAIRDGGTGTNSVSQYALLRGTTTAESGAGKGALAEVSIISTLGFDGTYGSGSEGAVLRLNSSGVPEFGEIDGGSF